jgi:hypothetical protein
VATNQKGKNRFIKEFCYILATCWNLLSSKYGYFRRKKPPQFLWQKTLVHYLLCSQNSFVWVVALSFFFFFFFFFWGGLNWWLKIKPKKKKNIKGEQFRSAKKGEFFNVLCHFHQPGGAVVDQSSPPPESSPLPEGNSITPILPLLFIQWREVANRKDLGLAAATNVECHNQRSWRSSCWDRQFSPEEGRTTN